MKNTNPIFSLKNFRSFGEEGADFELAPITVLTGCNSAGKSSLVKALMLLSKEETKQNIPSVSKDLKLSSKDLCLGGYKTVANEGKDIRISYKVWSTYIQEDVIVTKCFRAKKHDVLNEGTLDSLILQKLDGTIIYQEKYDCSIRELLPEHNIESIKDEFYRYYNVCCAVKILELLPLFEKKSEKDDENIDITLVHHLVDEYLDFVGITKSEAVLLWNKFNKEAFSAVIDAENNFVGKSYIALRDVIKKPTDILWKLMKEIFIQHIVKEVCTPFFVQQPMYINSISAQIARLYSTEDDNKMSIALRNWNDRNIYYKSDLTGVSYIPGSFLNRWIKRYGIGDRIEVEGMEEGLGLKIYLAKGKDRRLLADEGYGITQLVSLLLQIDNSIPVYVVSEKEEAFMEKEEYKLKMKYSVFPRFIPHIIYVEEPEIHLHPKYQSWLAVMFVEAYQKYNIHFIIETHSEYLIRKLQVMVADKEHPFTSNDVSLNYVEKDENGVSINRKIEILEDGRLSESFGPGFFDEATGLSMHLLKIKMESI